MLPKYPNFKRLELSDKSDIHEFTKVYPPYADFNLAGTWSWDVREQMQISQLNDNYVIRFINYETGEPFYTFLGKTMVNETAATLLDRSREEGLDLVLRLIPEVVSESLDNSIFFVEEDRDNFDYVYDLENLRKLEGSRYASKRLRLNRFIKQYSGVNIKKISIEDTRSQEEMEVLYTEWIDKKAKKEQSYESYAENIALKRIFASSKIFNFESLGVFIENKLIAFSICEMLESEYAISHVVKGSFDFTGVYEFIMQKTSEMLVAKGKRLFNFEQDLGHAGLRQAKLSFRPNFFLRKYVVKYK